MATEQMIEGKYQKRLATGAADSVNLLGKIEIYVLLFLALLLMVIVLNTPKSSTEEED